MVLCPTASRQDQRIVGCYFAALSNAPQLLCKGSNVFANRSQRFFGPGIQVNRQNLCPSRMQGAVANLQVLQVQIVKQCFLGQYPDVSFGNLEWLCKCTGTIGLLHSQDTLAM